MSEIFSCDFRVGWEHLDSNGHMANTAYLDLAVNVRMRFFEASGFALQEFERLRIGPVVRRDEIEYFREFHLLNELGVTLSAAGLSADGSRMLLRNEFFRQGVLAARVTSTVGWFDLEQRKLTKPPAKLLEALQAMARTEDFRELPGSSR